MQWLIDLVIEAIGIPPTFIDRGDPAAFDYVLGDFTRDDAWHELDLSAIVPEGASAVAINVAILATAANKQFQLRTHDNANNINKAFFNTQAAFIASIGDMTVHPDTDRKIDYFANAGLDLAINFVIKGWWL